jgi:hypothetical protein
MRRDNSTAISDEEASGFTNTLEKVLKPPKERLTDNYCTVTINQTSERDTGNPFWDKIRPKNVPEIEG